MAAAKSSIARKRNLSLDLMAATKENEERLKVWATLTSIDKNLTPTIATASNKSTKLDIHAHLYARNTKERNGIQNEVTTTNPTIQFSELKKTWFQKLFSWRYSMVLLLQSSFVVSMFIRNCLPMAMICMVKPRSAQPHEQHESPNRTRHELSFQSPFESNNSFHGNDTNSEDSHYEFDWNPEVQGLVLTSIMFTTFIGPLLVAMIKERVGIKHTMSVLNIISALLTFLSPIAARTSPYCLVVIRLLVGITMGGAVIAVGECLAWWAPQDEKLTMTSLTFTGVNIGTVLASLFSGYLCLMPWDNGWPFVFYIFAMATLIWGIFWHFLSSVKPDDHPYISEKEKQYIIHHRIGMDSNSGKKVKPPYRKLMTSVPVLAYFAVGICHIWATQVLFTYLPTFLNKQMKFAVQETGMLSSLISLFRMLGTFWWTAIGNKTVPYIGTNKSRKICICSGFFLTGVSAVAVGFFDENYKWVVQGMLLFLMINQSVGSSTITALPLDMAPRYAGLLSGMHMSVGSLFAISGPLLTSAITARGTHEEWQTIWIIMGCIFFLGAVIFLIFGHAKMQPWADVKETDASNIVSPFVTMGRRFTTIIEAPPLSPSSPLDNHFAFNQQPQTQPDNALSQLASASKENSDIEKSEIVKDIVVSAVETDDSTSSMDDGNTNYGYNENENMNEIITPVRVRAYSEFGLEVLRSKKTKEEDSDLERGEGLTSESSKPLQLNHTELVHEKVDEVTSGTVSEVFEENEEKNGSKFNDIEITYL